MAALTPLQEARNARARRVIQARTARERDARLDAALAEFFAEPAAAPAHHEVVPTSLHGGYHLVAVTERPTELVRAATACGLAAWIGPGLWAPANQPATCTTCLRATRPSA